MDEIMEDGNLVDRVRILLQRDMQYYQAMQTVLRESLCGRVSGGKLDFPRHASFAAIKIVKWWEAEFLFAFRYPSGLCISTEKGSFTDKGNQVIKMTKPSEFILLVVDTAEQLIEHLHTLIQESLDHADLAVLTATLGAAALIRNCLWCYKKQSKDKIPTLSSEKLSKCYKAYQEMTEEVAERLLDLHCRLISVYILNEADSLSWQSDKPFFENERSSFIIQMWWLYMQGTKADLWHTVSPKMAQRIFSGMLNESLTIIVTRFIHGRPTLARSDQFWADAFNVLSCTAHLSLSVCSDVKELIGIHLNKLSIIMRDIQSKCHELFICLLLRGIPLKSLYQACRNGLENMSMLQKRIGPAPWLLISAPRLFGSSKLQTNYSKLSKSEVLIFQINVMRSQAQANWTQLLKVLSMNDCSVARLLLCNLIKQCINKEDKFNQKQENTIFKEKNNKCGKFLCTGCYDNLLNLPPTLCLFSLMYISINMEIDPIDAVIPALKQDINWSNYLDRQQIWNQNRPPWLNAILEPFKDMMTPTVDILLDAVKTGASIYQAMSIALTCFAELFICIPITVLRVIQCINKNIPAHCHPIGGSVILQVFCAALYSSLFVISINDTCDKTIGKETPRSIVEPCSFDPQNKYATATALGEALCSIDEHNKHTDQIEDLLSLIEEWIDKEIKSLYMKKLDMASMWIEIYTDELLFTEIGRQSLKISYEYLIRSSDWILKNLICGLHEESIKVDFLNTTDVYTISKPLTYIIFHIDDAPFDQWLTNFNETTWQIILNTPLSMAFEQMRNQILIRPQLKNLDQLNQSERDVALALKRLCSPLQSTTFD